MVVVRARLAETRARVSGEAGGFGRGGSREGGSAAEVHTGDVEGRLAELGTLLLDGGVSVTDTRRSLERVRDAQLPSQPLHFFVFPGTVMISRGETSGPIHGGGPALGGLTTRQASRGLRLVRELERKQLGLDASTARIRSILQHRAAHPDLAWTLGSALIAVGLAVLFHCPWWAVVLSALTGIVVGFVSAVMGRITQAAGIVPFAATFLSTVLVGLSASWLGLGPVPLFAVCAPIAILVPGAMITNALLELTSDDIVTGSARLVSGLVVLGFMTAGIIAGSALTGLRLDPGSAALIGDTPATLAAGGAGWAALPPPWFAWAGVVALACGIGSAFGAGQRLTVVSIAAMVVAYGLLTLLTPRLGSIVATGLTAAILFLVSRLLERAPATVPSAVSFQPAFLLLVPGTVGLVALTTLDPSALSTTPLTFVSLCIGTKAGAVLADADWRRLLPRDRVGSGSNGIRVRRVTEDGRLEHGRA